MTFKSKIRNAFGNKSRFENTFNEIKTAIGHVKSKIYLKDIKISMRWKKCLMTTYNSLNQLRETSKINLLLFKEIKEEVNNNLIIDVKNEITLNGRHQALKGVFKSDPKAHLW